MDIKQTLEFIKKAHAGQKYGNRPYWTHPLQVAEMGKSFFGSKFQDSHYRVSLLHDVVEDTKYTVDDLISLGYLKTDEEAEALSLLSKDKRLDYKANIKRISSSGNRIAMMTKYADNYVNFSGDKSDWDPKKKEKSQHKYAWSLNHLGTILNVKNDFDPTGF